MLGKATGKKGHKIEGCMVALGGTWQAYNEEAGVSNTSCLAMADCLGSSMSKANNGGLVVPKWYVTSNKQACDIPFI